MRAEEDMHRAAAEVSGLSFLTVLSPQRLSQNPVGPEYLQL